MSFIKNLISPKFVTNKIKQSPKYTLFRTLISYVVFVAFYAATAYIFNCFDSDRILLGIIFHLIDLPITLYALLSLFYSVFTIVQSIKSFKGNIIYAIINIILALGYLVLFVLVWGYIISYLI